MEFRADIFIRGGDKMANETVSRLAKDMLFDSVDPGGLDKGDLLEDLAGLQPWATKGS